MLTPKDYEKLNRFYEENEIFRELFQAIEKDHLLSLSKISHEIRNPVTLINGFLQLMADEHPQIKQWNYWCDIEENMAFLRELLHELSQYHNAATLHRRDCNMYQLLQSIVMACTPSYAEKGILISLEKRSAIPTFLLDVTKIKEAFLNLFRNAMEAMPMGGEIRCSIDCDGETVTVKVADNGSGIPQEYMKDLFDAFVTHKKNGSGLGLAIVNQVVIAHHGELSVSSKEGEGSVFTIALPVQY